MRHDRQSQPKSGEVEADAGAVGGPPNGSAGGSARGTAGGPARGSAGATGGRTFGKSGRREPAGRRPWGRSSRRTGGRKLGREPARPVRRAPGSVNGRPGHGSVHAGLVCVAAGGVASPGWRSRRTCAGLQGAVRRNRGSERNWRRRIYLGCDGGLANGDDTLGQPGAGAAIRGPRRRGHVIA
jgi:hypothetical protein